MAKLRKGAPDESTKGERARDLIALDPILARAVLPELALRRLQGYG
jgi:hypothetical protein